MDLQAFESGVIERANTQGKVTEDFNNKLSALEPLLPHARDLTVFTQYRDLHSPIESSRRSWTRSPSVSTST